MRPRPPRFVLLAKESPTDPAWTWVTFLRRGQEASKLTARRVLQAHCLDAARDIVSEASWVCVQVVLPRESPSSPPQVWTWTSPLAEASWRAAQLRARGIRA